MQSTGEYSNMQQETEEERFTFRDLLRDWWTRFIHALRYWRLIGLAGIILGLLCLGYALIKKPTYTARLSFIVEESKAGGGSIASALAGQFGFDIGSLTGGNGILAGDNVLELLKSQSFIKKTLLTPYGDSTAKISLADRYADVYGWKESWKNSSEVGRQVNFPVNQTGFSRLEDSLLQRIMKRISEEELSIAKPDKKLGVFELTVSTRDELLSQVFCERLLKIATDFYVETKTRRLTNNILRLQRRADSLGGLLDRRTVSSAETERLLLDVNPAYSSPVANAEISSRNKLIQSTVYAEVIKNLEISRTALVQETPTVQVVDHPELPLKKNRIKPLLALLAGMAIGCAIAIIALAAGYRKQKL
jgi:hypothetical protein